MRTFALGAVIVMVFVALFGAGTAAAQDDMCYQKGGTFDAEQQRCVINTGIIIDIKYPLEAVQYPFVEQTVDEFLNGIRAEYVNSFANMDTTVWSPGPWGLNIDYEVFQFSPDVLSIKFNIGDYTGGAHGNLFFRTYTFDLTQERVLTLTDLFQPGADVLGTIAPIVQQSLATQLGDMADTQWIQDGTSTLDDYASFAVTPDAQVFYFPPYQVAAYAVGPQTVSIPLADLSGVLGPMFGAVQG
ncbi:MAG: DUF3298/DUF4163 domain-containing protein [Chloroflexi bacterium]|nr:MAG: DUF3298/DUF4163 domain-containing protein [Chloroflexota bacterium]